MFFNKKPKEHTKTFVVVGLRYHDAPKIMEDVEKFRWTKRELIEECAYAPVGEKMWSSLATLEIEHGEYEGAVRILTDDAFIGYIPKEDCAEAREIIEKNILCCYVEIQDGMHYMLDEDDEVVTFKKRMNGTVTINYADKIDK